MRPRWHMLVAVLIFASGCSTETDLIATPTIDLGPQGQALFERVPPQLQTSDMTIIYAADRAVEEQTIFGPKYSTGRADHLAFGTAVVGIKPEISWDELVKQCTTNQRTRTLSLEMKLTVEGGRLAVPLSEMEVREGRYRLTEAEVTELTASKQRLRDLLSKQLALSPRKDVYIFVHGFNNSFDDAVFRLAQMWHFAGRPGVAIAYTWPAGHKGLLGYAYDRESGEFTIYHLRKFLQDVAAVPEVERIHLIAHSRGTDVAITALRELNIEYKAKGVSTQEALKLENLVLAAPDLDSDVFEQRFAIEDLHMAAKRTTVYLSHGDLALSLSRWLFGSRGRVGTLTPDDIKPDARLKLTQLNRLDMIECNVSGYSTSHDYAFAHPAVVSDMFLLLRDGKLPGDENGRPLRSPVNGIWEIENDYLLVDRGGKK